MPKYHPRLNGQRLQTSRNIENKTEKQFFSRFDFRQTTKPLGLKGLLFKKEKDTHINIQIFQQQFVWQK